MSAPAPQSANRAMYEEGCCDKIAEIWVRFIGDLQLFRARFNEMVGLFDGSTPREGRINLCCIVDQWDDDWGLTLEDFIRLRGEIEGWIVAHMASYGGVKRFNRRCDGYSTGKNG